MTHIVTDAQGIEYEVRWKDQLPPEPVFIRLSDGKKFDVIEA